MTRKESWENEDVKRNRKTQKEVRREKNNDNNKRE